VVGFDHLDRIEATVGDLLEFLVDFHGVFMVQVVQVVETVLVAVL